MSSLTRPSKTDVVSDFRRGQILEAARQSFIRFGVADTTVEGIARAAGVAKGTVYLYYRSKDEILRQLLTRDLGEFHDETVPTITAAGPIDRRLHGFLTATLAFFERKRDFMEHCQLEMSADVRRKARQKLGLVFTAQTDAWRAAIDEAIANGNAARIDTEAAARTIVSLAHGLAVQRLRGWYTGSVEASVASATALLSQGLAPR